MDMSPVLRHIDQLYDIPFSEWLSRGDKIFLGSASPQRICRFCGLSSKKTTFKHIAHGIPESIGNKRLILRDECDQCNDYFSNTIEDSFDKYIKPFRTVFAVKGKSNKVPSYKTKGGTARIDISDNAMIISGDEDLIFEPNKEKNHHVLELHRESYRPLAVYKTLIKMALSTVNAGVLSQLGEIIKWIRFGKNEEYFPGPHFMIEKFLPGPPVGGDLFVTTFERRKSTNPEYAFLMTLVAMGSVALQIGIPKRGERVKKIALFPVSEEDRPGGAVQIEGRNLTSNDFTPGGKMQFHMSQSLTAEKDGGCLPDDIL